MAATASNTVSSLNANKASTVSTSISTSASAAQAASISAAASAVGIMASDAKLEKEKNLMGESADFNLKNEAEAAEQEIDLSYPDAFLCPISREVMTDPVTASDNITYDRKSIAEWIERQKGKGVIYSPMTGQALVPFVTVKDPKAKDSKDNKGNQEKVILNLKKNEALEKALNKKKQQNQVEKDAYLAHVIQQRETALYKDTNHEANIASLKTTIEAQKLERQREKQQSLERAKEEEQRKKIDLLPEQLAKEALLVETKKRIDLETQLKNLQTKWSSQSSDAKTAADLVYTAATAVASTATVSASATTTAAAASAASSAALIYSAAGMTGIASNDHVQEAKAKRSLELYNWVLKYREEGLNHMNDAVNGYSPYNANQSFRNALWSYKRAFESLTEICKLNGDLPTQEMYETGRDICFKIGELYNNQMCANSYDHNDMVQYKLSAETYFQKASELGHDHANCELAKLYEVGYFGKDAWYEGNIIMQSFERAKQYLEKAAAKGCDGAKRKLATYAQKASPNK
jgi:hypothetical protein